jgi:hypothetical protein
MRIELIGKHSKAGLSAEKKSIKIGNPNADPSLNKTLKNDFPIQQHLIQLLEP